MPPPPTQKLDYAQVVIPETGAVARLFAVAGLTAGLYGSFGVITAVASASICPEYGMVYGAARNWQWIEMVLGLVAIDFLFSLAAAFFASMTYGAVTAGILSLSRLLFPFALAATTLLAMYLGLGLASFSLARFSPFTYTETFPHAATATHLPSFAWVDGSIWGLYIGGPLSLVVLITAIVKAANRYRDES